MKRKFNFNLGDLVTHRFINYGYGIIIEKRESINFGDILHAYVVHFPKQDLKRLVYCTEIDEHIPSRGHCSK
jgi:RNA polymerase-interacting CarD/CdnL/TRCF family regulator|tara:strand:- start:99 stop:314 length:216 start_codon:yes stop_codon:yes gene_type:complete